MTSSDPDINPSLREQLSCRAKHFLSICLLMSIFLCVGWVEYRKGQDLSTTSELSINFTAEYVVVVLQLFPLVWAVCNVAGLLLMNPFPPNPKIQVKHSSTPKLCFRVVTKGSFPNLVKQNVERNMNVCHKIGLDNFCYEIVTDHTVNIRETINLREIVVPSGYVTPNKTLYKARALHYCLESHVNRLNDDDWIVHLDEETVLTESAIIGLMNAAGLDKCDIGTGLITYSNLGVVNWFTTLAENVRVGLDLGLQRLSFKHFGAPVFGMKGSFILAKNSVERDIGFDFGPKGSITEDCMFAMSAWKRGYRFNFVEGEMWEKSAFTVIDYIKQRARWYIGRYFVLACRNIPFRYKIFILFSFLSTSVLPFIYIIVITSWVFTTTRYTSPYWIITIALMLVRSNTLYLFALGSIKSTSHRRGLLVRVVQCILTMVLVPIFGTLECLATIYGMWKRHSLKFHVVQKEEVKLINNNVESVV